MTSYPGGVPRHDVVERHGTSESDTSKVLTPDGSGGVQWATGGGGAGHDPVSLSAAADTVLSLATQEIGLDTQVANTVLAGPAAGVDAAPTFRALAFADIPSTSDGETHPSTVLAADASGELRVARLRMGTASSSAKLGIWTSQDENLIYLVSEYSGANLSTMLFMRGVNENDGAFSTRLLSDTSYSRFSFRVGGKLEWGPGNTARDVNLYRLGDDFLTTDDSFRVGGYLSVGTSELAFPLNVVGGADGVETQMLSIRSDSISTNTATGLNLINSSAGDPSHHRAQIVAIRTNSPASGATDLLVRVSDGAAMQAAVIIKAGGEFGIGETAPDYKLDVNGVIGVAENGGDPSTVAGKAVFYGKEVGTVCEAFAGDDGGTFVQLTSHPTAVPFDAEPWEYVISSGNHYIGIQRYLRIEKALRYLEQQSGEQFIFDAPITRRAWHLDEAQRGSQRPLPDFVRQFLAAQEV